jgi:hypothetical protein
MTLVPLSVSNDARERVCTVLNDLPFLAYHVENLADGRKVCITKPGGKSTFGYMKVNDFMVWVYDDNKKDRWRISHQEIADDMRAKLQADKQLASEFIDVLNRVCEGAEPNDLLDLPPGFAALPGFPPDLVLKVYKWIWIQEDCNYPKAQGRWMSMKGILALRDSA